MISLVLQLDSFITMIYLRSLTTSTFCVWHNFVLFTHKDPLYGNQEDSSSGRSRSYDEMSLQETGDQPYDGLHAFQDNGDHDLDNSRLC